VGGKRTLRLRPNEGSNTGMRSSSLNKHLFYGTMLVLLFLGSLGAVFRDDVEGKVVTVVCATVLFLIAILSYVRRHRLLP
jgi:hypothetical protein